MRQKLTKEDILDQAKAIVTGDRQNDYGEVEDNFQTIANLFNAYLKSKCNRKSEITAQDVAVMMILVKCARISSGHHKDDNWVDIAGYAACGGSLVKEPGAREFYFECSPTKIDDEIMGKLVGVTELDDGASIRIKPTGMSRDDIERITDINGTF